ncbi:MAG: hypothetical protein II877_04735 [Synergistaceae bacterium]|nr:hypothetical protein [Synergistaceae bacterium]
MANKKALELDERLRKLIDDEFARYEKYLPSIQDVQQYQRKRKEYWENISARLKEEAEINGRADDKPAGE